MGFLDERLPETNGRAFPHGISLFTPTQNGSVNQLVAVALPAFPPKPPGRDGQLSSAVLPPDALSGKGSLGLNRNDDSNRVREAIHADALVKHIPPDFAKVVCKSQDLCSTYPGQGEQKIATMKKRVPEMHIWPWLRGDAFMTDSFRLETLNIWGGRLYQPLLNHVRKQASTVDLFCFQEVYSTHSRHLFTKERGEAIDGSPPSNDLPERANIYQELVNALPDFVGYFSSCQDRHAYSGPVDFDLSFGLAIFVRKTLSVEQVGEYFVHRQKNSIVGTDNATIGRNLQYMQLRLAGKPVTAINMHGLWNGQGKTDSPERLEQFRKVKAFVEAINDATILCGDLNVLPTTQSLALLEESLRNLVKVHGITATRTRWYTQADRFADYVFVSPDIQVEEFHVLDEDMSDHAPLLLTVRKHLLAHDMSQTGTT